ncbi:cytochrome P450 CYP749A22-like [Mangifera indica]|uniref:cytochrome P450 CYP749A22-like n=1 Tax=Mangifera indica TaxID=29780 RepID=UPI001CF9B3F5|nr:cytochrome P450 CYP749A22-like [Mangifera indica]
MTPTIVASVNVMLDKWSLFEGTEIDMFDEFKVLTSDLISRSAFGSNYLEGEKLFRMLSKMVSFFSKNEFKITTPGFGKLVKTHDDIEGDKLQQGIRASIVEIIKREENVKTEELDSYGSDFLGNLLKAYHTKDETKKISRDVLIDECKTLFTGGYETTTNLLSWTILLLATQHRLARQGKERGSRIIFPANPR